MALSFLMFSHPSCLLFLCFLPHLISPFTVPFTTVQSSISQHSKTFFYVSTNNSLSSLFKRPGIRELGEEYKIIQGRITERYARGRVAREAYEAEEAAAKEAEKGNVVVQKKTE